MEEKVNFCDFCGHLLWTAPYELTKLYTAKNVLWTRISVLNDFIEERLVFTFQGRQKSEEHNAIWLTFMIYSVKQLSAASVDRQSSTIIH